VRGRDDGGKVTNVQYKANQNCHYEPPLYNEDLLIKIYLKKKESSRRTKGMAQVIECLLSKHESLSSNPSTTKKKERKLNERKASNQIWHYTAVIPDIQEVEAGGSQV
jgi:hypothetical protein